MIQSLTVKIADCEETSASVIVMVQGFKLLLGTYVIVINNEGLEDRTLSAGVILFYHNSE